MATTSSNRPRPFFLFICVFAWWLLLALAVRTAAASSPSSSEPPEGVEAEVVKVDLGKGRVVLGTAERSRTGKKYFAFRAIPYALAPVGDLRFSPPSPVGLPEGVLDATLPGQPCAQAALGINGGVEDCLNLYVYTPKRGSESEALPVVVWLHGGAFVVGGAAGLDPSILMEKDLVLIIPQYRLGLLGFLNTESEDAWGNQGMLDQAAALRWVQQNAKFFGGDPDQVTLAGDCAGGASVVYHLMSPKSQGLFERGISLSGNPLSPWGFQTRGRRLLLLMANYVKCPAYSSEVLVHCFRSLTLEEILEAQQLFTESRDLLVGNHRQGPSVQYNASIDSEAEFLQVHPLTALREGETLRKVPLLMGLTRDVGSYLVDMVLYDFILFKLKDDPNFLDELITMILQESHLWDVSDHLDEFVDFYFGDLMTTTTRSFRSLERMLPGLAKMLGDIHYRSGMVKTVELLAPHMPVYLYRYEYEGGANLFSVRHPPPSTSDDADADADVDADADIPPLPPAVGHGDEVFMILPEKDVLTLTDSQVEFSAKLVDVLYNFVSGKEPLEDLWPATSAEGLEALVLGSEGQITLEPFVEGDTKVMLEHIHEYHFKKYYETEEEEQLNKEDGTTKVEGVTEADEETTVVKDEL